MLERELEGASFPSWVSRNGNCSSRVKLILLLVTYKASKSKIWFDRLVKLDIIDILRPKTQIRFSKSAWPKTASLRNLLYTILTVLFPEEIVQLHICSTDFVEFCHCTVQIGFVHRTCYPYYMAGSWWQSVMGLIITVPLVSYVILADYSPSSKGLMIPNITWLFRKMTGQNFTGLGRRPGKFAPASRIRVSLSWPHLIPREKNICSAAFLHGSNSMSFSHLGTNRYSSPFPAPSNMQPRTSNAIRMTYGNVAVKYTTWNVMANVRYWCSIWIFLGEVWFVTWWRGRGEENTAACPEYLPHFNIVGRIILGKLYSERSSY